MQKVTIRNIGIIIKPKEGGKKEGGVKSTHNRPPKYPITGELIKKLRISKGLTQKQLAEKSQLSLTSITNWEQGIHDPSKAYKRSIELLLKALDTSLDELIKELEK